MSAEADFINPARKKTPNIKSRRFMFSSRSLYSNKNTICDPLIWVIRNIIVNYRSISQSANGAPEQHGSTLIPHFAHWPWPWTKITCKTVAHIGHLSSQCFGDFSPFASCMFSIKILQFYSVGPNDWICFNCYCDRSELIFNYGKPREPFPLLRIFIWQSI